MLLGRNEENCSNIQNSSNFEVCWYPIILKISVSFFLNILGWINVNQIISPPVPFIDDIVK